MWNTRALRHEIEDMFSVLSVPEYEGFQIIAENATGTSTARTGAPEVYQDPALYREHRRKTWRESKARKRAREEA